VHCPLAHTDVLQPELTLQYVPLGKGAEHKNEEHKILVVQSGDVSSSRVRLATCTIIKTVTHKDVQATA
jgi:hypothetical protein